MAYARFAPCPHCGIPLSFFEGISGSKLDPKCPSCAKVVTVDRATFLQRDHSAPPPAVRTQPR